MKGFARAFFILVTLLVGGVAFSEGSTESAPKGGLLPPSSGWKLVWSDMFDKDGPADSGVWNYEEYPPMAFNGELQAYTTRPENARIENQRLVIDALNDGWHHYKYTSARISSSPTLSLLYGRVDFCAKLPVGRGTWAALWLLPVDPAGYGYMWPDSGEMDVMEEVGFEGNQVHGTLHTSAFNYTLGTQITASKPVNVTKWHVYSLEWYPDHISLLLDNQVYLTFNKEAGGWQRWPFDKPFYLIMNLAIGGAWGGQHGVAKTIFPAKMEVSWVRIYQSPSVPQSKFFLSK